MKIDLGWLKLDIEEANFLAGCAITLAIVAVTIIMVVGIMTGAIHD